MKHPRPRFVTVASPYARSRGVRANGRLKTVHVPPLPPHPGELLDASYRALLDASSSAILLLSPESIILGWNRAAETISGWSAHEVLGRRYVDRYVPVEARAAFLAALARVTEGSEVRGCEFPLMGRTGLQTRLSWNMTQVVGPYGTYWASWRSEPLSSPRPSRKRHPGLRRLEFGARPAACRARWKKNGAELPGSCTMSLDRP